MTLNQALISATTLNSSVSSVTIPVPSGYTDLRLVFSARNDTSPSIWYEHVRLTFNGGGGNYTSKMIYGNGSGAYGADDSGGGSTYAPWAGIFCAGNSTANTFSNCEIYVPNYSVSGVAKNFSGESVSEGMVGGGVTGTTAQAMLWTGTAAITSITLAAAVGNFVAGTEFTLYGITKLGVTPTQTPKATGGDIIKNDGTYWYHAFLSTGAFIPQQSLNADVLVVAGGGGGGSWTGGGGGAGGLLGFTSQLLSAAPYTCTVGAGGAGGTYSAPSGVRGSNSQFGSLTATIGGGGGAGYNGAYAYPLTGGSGGGGTSTNGAEGTGAAGTAGQGYAGGNGIGAPYYHGGGGGGSAQVGYPATGSPIAAGAGGNGVSTYSSWGLATSTGQNVSGTVYYAGGGGGGNNGGGAQGVGGYGGGGAGRVYFNEPSFSGTANTGGGGGGAATGSGTTATAGGNGGSGIVIIRYAMA